MNSNSLISSGDPILGDLDAVRHNWRWVLASGIAFVSLGAMAFGYIGGTHGTGGDLRVHPR